MQTHNRFRIIALLAGCALVLGSACQHQKSAETPPVGYRIGLGPWVGFGPLYVARDKGFFKEQGIEAELIVLTGVAERSSALRSGKLDALAAPVDYFVLSSGNGVPATIVMAIDESVGGDGIVAKKGVQHIRDLRGKKVAAQRGLPSDFFLRAVLQENDMSAEDIEYIDMETAQAGAAFLTGDVDAAVVWEPWLTRAKERGNGHILASTRDYPNLIVDCLAVTQSSLQSNTDVVQRVVNAVVNAIAYAKANPMEASEVAAKYFDVDPPRYRAILEGVDFVGLDRNREYFGKPGHPGAIFEVASRASAIWQRARATTARVKEQDIISTHFLPPMKMDRETPQD